jgi:hypothetical protein
MKQLNTEDFIKRSNKVHKNKYNYGKTNYTGAKNKVTITCPKHGDFEILPYNHLSGQGCVRCRKCTCTEDFIKKANIVHNNKYIYDKSIFIRSNQKVTITCPKHGDFIQTPNGHLGGHGCPMCAKENNLFRIKESAKTTSKFIDEAISIHGSRYDYSKVNYINNRTPVTIICPEHGEFQQIPTVHINAKGGCPICGNISAGEKQKLTKERFIELAKNIHGNRYDYSRANYINYKTVITIICPEHGEFLQTPQKHLSAGHGCPNCCKSFLEKSVRDLLIEGNINYEQEKSWEWLTCKSKMRVDFFLPDKKLAIECQGRQHFEAIDLFGGEEEFLDRVKRDELKYKLCLDHGVNLIYYSNISTAKYNYPHKVYENLADLKKFLLG